MGWKAFKEHFGIQHIVIVTDAGICVGSSYVHNLLLIDCKTGMVHENQTFSGIGAREFPKLMAATPQEILQLINVEDTFSADIAVYTHENGRIVEYLCEETGWPNVTHDGVLMYYNTFSEDKALVVKWAKQEMESEIRYAKKDIQHLEASLVKARARLAEAQAQRESLEELTCPGKVVTWCAGN